MKFLIVLLLAAVVAADWDDHFDIDDDDFRYQPAFYRAASRGRSVFYSADDSGEESAESMETDTRIPGAVQYSAFQPATTFYSATPAVQGRYVVDFDDDDGFFDDDDITFVYGSHSAQPAVATAAQTASAAQPAVAQYYSGQPAAAAHGQYIVGDFDDDFDDDDRHYVFTGNAVAQPAAVQSFSVAQPTVQTYSAPAVKSFSAVAQPAVQTYSAPAVNSFSAVAQPAVQTYSAPAVHSVSQPAAVVQSYSVQSSVPSFSSSSAVAPVQTYSYSAPSFYSVPQAVMPFFYRSAQYVQPAAAATVYSSASPAATHNFVYSYRHDKSSEEK